MPKPELALSVQQPWAWLLVHGIKGIENRTWALPKGIWEQRVYIHASKTYDWEGHHWIREKGLVLNLLEVSENAMAQRGGLVGELRFYATMWTLLTKDTSPWFTGPFGWLVADPVAYDRMIPCKGKLRFFKPDLPQVEGQ